MSPENIPTKMVFRCYGYRTRGGTWIASCIDLSLMVERPSMQEGIKALHEQIDLYLQSVQDIEDKGSISYLLPRLSPWRERLFYHIIATACRFRGVCRNLAFNSKEEYPLPQTA
jgi:hypothetical protein